MTDLPCATLGWEALKRPTRNCATFSARSLSRVARSLSVATWFRSRARRNDWTVAVAARTTTSVAARVPKATAALCLRMNFPKR